MFTGFGHLARLHNLPENDPQVSSKQMWYWKMVKNNWLKFLKPFRVPSPSFLKNGCFPKSVRWQRLLSSKVGKKKSTRYCLVLTTIYHKFCTISVQFVLNHQRSTGWFCFWGVGGTRWNWVPSNPTSSCWASKLDILWLVVSTLWKIFANWDEYSQYMGKHVPNHQPVLDVSPCSNIFSG